MLLLCAGNYCSSDVLSFRGSAAETQCLTYQHGDLIFSN